jgi:hypothetical protein
MWLSGVHGCTLRALEEQVVGVDSTWRVPVWTFWFGLVVQDGVFGLCISDSMTPMHHREESVLVQFEASRGIEISATVTSDCFFSLVWFSLLSSFWLD